MISLWPHCGRLKAWHCNTIHSQRNNWMVPNLGTMYLDIIPTLMQPSLDSESMISTVIDHCYMYNGHHNWSLLTYKVNCPIHHLLGLQDHLNHTQYSFDSPQPTPCHSLFFSPVVVRCAGLCLFCFYYSLSVDLLASFMGHPLPVLDMPNAYLVGIIPVIHRLGTVLAIRTLCRITIKVNLS